MYMLVFVDVERPVLLSYQICNGSMMKRQTDMHKIVHAKTDYERHIGLCILAYSCMQKTLLQFCKSSLYISCLFLNDLHSYCTCSMSENEDELLTCSLYSSRQQIVLTYSNSVRFEPVTQELPIHIRSAQLRGLALLDIFKSDLCFLKVAHNNLKDCVGFS